MPELRDLQDLLDKADTYRPGRGIPEPPTEEEVTRCIQVLMSRQCIYPHQNHLARSYNIMACPDYQEFFRRYFSAMGLEFHFDPRSRMIALRVPGIDKKRYDWQASRLKKDETLVLYTIKLAYEEGFRANQMGTRGEVEITTNDLIDKLDVVANVQLEESRMMAILKLLERKGVVHIGELDPIERIRSLTILPGIEVACPEVYMQAVADWAEQQPQIGTAPTVEPVEETAEAEEDVDV
ncbi:DUF4194 domain-containing protein [Telmatospirillum sp.]|uniref:DUF4194 domain-containing protein n=1 Tax=Telmatospirillum sp. TaxID=2079197 RepID=UPI00284A1D7F|nr:DUF4194 domain-containing protein [Telmatospirillum sp.]MDR3439732.1 DUF4194 domain-containing protein [Telmatospirillum sp.]